MDLIKSMKVKKSERYLFKTIFKIYNLKLNFKQISKFCKKKRVQVIDKVRTSFCFFQTYSTY